MWNHGKDYPSKKYMWHLFPRYESSVDVFAHAVGFFVGHLSHFKLIDIQYSIQERSPKAPLLLLGCNTSLLLPEIEDGLLYCPIIQHDG